MRTQLRNAWNSRAPLERTIISILAVSIIAALYLWLVQSGGRAQIRLHENVATLRGQATQLEQHSAELKHLRTKPLTSSSQTDLRKLVQAQIAVTGLSPALVKLDTTAADQVVVVFGAIAFTEWLNWVVSMESQQVRLDACRIEALSAPGMVSVTATLMRTGHQ